MRNFKLMMSYDGTSYHGFQRQENAYTIQQEIEDTIKKITGEKTIIYGCSRTDTGVHANQFCFNVKLENTITSKGLQRALNCNLDDAIAILSCEEVDESFHARYDCKGKEYIYKIHNSEIKNPFLKDKAFRYWLPLDEKLLNQSAQHFIGTHDFKGFCSVGSLRQHTIRTIHKLEIKREGDIIIILVKGDGFLYNMVRIIIGTLIFVNEGKIKESDLDEIILSQDRKKAGKTAPSHGLYLNKVFYDTLSEEV